ncbi:MAG: potassium channel family protein [Candidatus Absconditabacteria bacterium]|nr:potassium channel family protein [Candidatus Absconditabacteria bacterium]
MKLKDIGKLFTKNLIITEILLVGLIIVIGAFTFHFVEGWKILDAFYFIISVMTTIGFGDFTPQTDIGKIFVMFYAIIGVPFFISIGGLFLETRFRKSIKQYLNKVYRELREAESEIQEVEEAVMKNLKKNLENTQETDLPTPNIFQETKKKHRWKLWSRK